LLYGGRGSSLYLFSYDGIAIGCAVAFHKTIAVALGLGENAILIDMDNIEVIEVDSLAPSCNAYDFIHN
jgi:hypothetical protein